MSLVKKNRVSGIFSFLADRDHIVQNNLEGPMGRRAHEFLDHSTDEVEEVGVLPPPVWFRSEGERKQFLMHMLPVLEIKNPRMGSS